MSFRFGGRSLSVSTDTGLPGFGCLTWSYPRCSPQEDDPGPPGGLPVFYSSALQAWMNKEPCQEVLSDVENSLQAISQDGPYGDKLVQQKGGKTSQDDGPYSYR